MRDAFGRCEPRRRDQARKEKGKQASQEGKVKSEHGGRRQDYLYKIWGTAVRTTCDKDPGAPVCPASCLDQDHMRHSLVAPLTAVRDARSPRCPPRRPRQSSGVERVVRGVLVVFGIELSSADATASGDGRNASQNKLHSVLHRSGSVPFCQLSGRISDESRKAYASTWRSSSHLAAIQLDQTESKPMHQGVVASDSSLFRPPRLTVRGVALQVRTNRLASDASDSLRPMW